MTQTASDTSETVSEAAAWGGPAGMSAWEGLMWRAEGDPRTRSTGVLLEILDRTPDPDRFRAAHVAAVARIPRLRERVVEPAVPLVQPAWSVDPNFDLDHHLMTVRLPGDGTQDELLELCRAVMRRPLDRARPPWEAVLVTGLDDDRAAYLLKFHHSLTDGLGLIQLLTLAHSRSAEPTGAAATVAAREPAAASPKRPTTDPRTLLATGAQAWASAVVQRSARLVPGAAAAVAQAARDPLGFGTTGMRFARSLRTVLTPPTGGRSPLFAGADTGLRLLTVDVPLDRLKTAGKAAGGSVNDAFVAGVIGGLRRYHEAHDTPLDHLPVAMPVSLRREGDPLGGNRFAGVRFAAPLFETDPAVRIEYVRDFVVAARDEPAIGFLDYLSPAITKLPTSAIIALSTQLMTSSDVQISNIKGLGQDVYLAGAKVERMYPMGPRPGVAAMIAMITYGNVCCLGINIAPALIPDHDTFRQCLADGFDEVLALAGPKRPRSKEKT